MFKKKFLISLFFVFLLSNNLIAAELPVRVLSKYKGPNEISQNILWEIEKKIDGIYYKDVFTGKYVILKTDTSGNPFDVDLFSQNQRATKGRQISVKGKAVKKQLIFISDGNPAPFDWLDPFDMSDSEVHVTKNAAGTAFMTKMIKTVSGITQEEAKNAGYINDNNLAFFDPEKPLYLIVLKKNEKATVIQLWQSDSPIWLYESNGDRTSYRSGE